MSFIFREKNAGTLPVQNLTKLLASIFTISRPFLVKPKTTAAGIVKPATLIATILPVLSLSRSIASHNLVAAFLTLPAALDIKFAAFSTDIPFFLLKIFLIESMIRRTKFGINFIIDCNTLPSSNLSLNFSPKVLLLSSKYEYDSRYDLLMNISTSSSAFSYIDASLSYASTIEPTTSNSDSITTDSISFIEE